jgi:hypothetical protein
MQLSIDQFVGWFDVFLGGEHLVFKDAITTYAHDIRAWTAVGFGGEALNMRHSHMYCGHSLLPIGHQIRRGAFLCVTKDAAEIGSYTGWTPNTGTQVTDVDDAVPDEETTAVEAATDGAAFTNEHDAHGEVRLIYGVQHTIRYRRQNSETAGILPAVVSGGARYTYQARAGGVDDWAVMRALWRTNPRTGLPWNRTAYNGSEWGAVART